STNPSQLPRGGAVRLGESRATGGDHWADSAPRLAQKLAHGLSLVSSLDATVGARCISAAAGSLTGGRPLPSLNFVPRCRCPTRAELCTSIGASSRTSLRYRWSSRAISRVLLIVPTMSFTSLGSSCTTLLPRCQIAHATVFDRALNQPTF